MILLGVSGLARGQSYYGENIGQKEENPLSIAGSVRFESAYLFRGKKLGQQGLQPSVELSYSECEGNLYIGTWHYSPFNSGQANEIDFYGGYCWQPTRIFTLDLGCTYYWYPNTPPTPLQQAALSRSREIYMGLSADVLFTPSIYFFYDFDREQTLLEISGGYRFSLEEYLSTDGFFFDVGGYIGWLQADAFNGNQRKGNEKWSNGYNYCGVTGDLVYVFNESISTSVGVRYGYNTDGTTTSFRDLNGNMPEMGPSHNFWYGINFSFQF